MQRENRKLAAIVAADVVSYSRLMSEDEEGTLQAFRAHRAELIDPLIAEHGGRIANTAGDSLLVEFASAVDALRCTIEIQREMAHRNEDVAEARQLLFRIGINVGDVIAEGDDLLGDGVNVAARLEALAEKGGICISHTVRDQVRDRLAINLQDLGEIAVKNIARPVHAFNVLGEGESATMPARPPAPWRKRAAWAALPLALVFAAGAWWQSRTPDSSAAGPAKMVHDLPARPSLAVLPFANLSGDPEQEYFADGIAEDLITDLSKISGLFVIARNSSFSYKGKAVKLRQMAQELGVRYVLQGSVRRAGGKVRINAQLVDASTGGHLWAERFDRDLADVFKLQDEVVANITAALAVELTDQEKAGRKQRGSNDDLEAHEYFLRGRQHLGRFTAKDAAKAKALFEKAITLDPGHAQALTALGRLHYNAWEIWGEARDQNLAVALELGQSAAAVDDALAGPHLLLSQVYSQLRQGKLAKAETDKALALAPRDADTLAGLGDVLRQSGRAHEAIGLLQSAMRLDPFYPAWYEFYLGDALFQVGQHQAAITALKRGAERNPDYPTFALFLSASYAALGRLDEARAAAAEVLRINPRFTLKAWSAHPPYDSEIYQQNYLAAFRKAGLPD